MRFTVLGLSILLFFLNSSALDDPSELRTQSDTRQMFALRDAVSRRSRTSDFFAGEVACAFNDARSCEQTFNNILAVDPKSADARQIHHILAYAALREGRYERSLHEIDAVLAIDPTDSDAKDTRPFMEALSHIPDQTVHGGGTGKISVQMNDGRLPLLINGKRAAYFFDTGANLSTVTESEALRLGMKIQEIKSGGVSLDINGNRISLRIASANSLALGSIELNNVAFLVAGNKQQPFADMAPGQRGLIGLTVLRAFGSIAWTRDGIFEVDRSPAPLNLSAANLCFDDITLIAEARFEGQALPFVLDTGAINSDLWPRFGSVAGDLIRKSGTHAFHTVTGMGGSQKFEVTSIPKVSLELGGESVSLQPARILGSQQETANQWFYGNLGIDVLRQAQNVKIDFRTMTLELNKAAGRRGHKR